MKLGRAVPTNKKSAFGSKEIRSLVKLAFGRLLVLPALKKKTLDKYFSRSLLVSGPNISVFRYPETPWDSNAHCLN